MKTFILNLVLCFTLLISLSGCMDLEFSDFSGLGGGYGGGYDFDWDDLYEATFYIDSITQVSDSKVKIWAQIRYDSVLIIKNREMKYYTLNGKPNTTIIQSEPDTIDFRTLPDSAIHWTGRNEWIYKYNVEVETLKKDVDYTVCISNEYTERGISKWIEMCMPVRLQ